MKVPRFLLSPALWFVLVLGWGGTLYWLSEQSHLPSPASFEGVDKLEHAVFFAAGSACFALGLRLAGAIRSRWASILAALLFCAFIGGLDEWHQLHTPGRSGGDVWDWTADSVGGLIGAVLALLLHRILSQKEPSSR